MLHVQSRANDDNEWRFVVDMTGLVEEFQAFVNGLEPEQIDEKTRDEFDRFVARFDKADDDMIAEFETLDTAARKASDKAETLEATIDALHEYGRTIVGDTWQPDATNVCFLVGWDAAKLLAEV